MNFEQLTEKYGGITPALPFEIHGDIIIKGGYPTHTHGLTAVGMPEFLIHARCFGVRDNAAVINNLFKYFTKDKGSFDKLAAGEDIEIQPWAPEHDMAICIRRVGHDFAAVKWAYEGADIEGMLFAQIYVKGDDHALTEEYFNDEREFAKDNETQAFDICDDCGKGRVGHA